MANDATVGLFMVARAVMLLGRSLTYHLLVYASKHREQTFSVLSYILLTALQVAHLQYLELLLFEYQRERKSKTEKKEKTESRMSAEFSQRLNWTNTEVHTLGASTY